MLFYPLWLFLSLPLQPLVQSCQFPFCLVTLLSMVALSPQVLLLPLRPFVLTPILSHIVVPHLLFRIILKCISNPLVLFLGLLVHLNFNFFFIFSKTLLQMFLLYICLELQNPQIAFSHGTTFLFHTPKMIMNATVTSLPTAKCLAFQHSPLFSTLLFFFFNTSTSSSCLCPCSLLYVSLSFATFCNFTIVLSTLILLRILEL